jgi:hypothetical protein
MSELELVDTDDLIEELQSRHDNLLIVGRKDLNLDHEAHLCFWSGGCTPALGLVKYAELRITEKIKQELLDAE